VQSRSVRVLFSSPDAHAGLGEAQRVAVAGGLVLEFEVKDTLVVYSRLHGY
jgi:hypothetical protein